VKPLAGAFTLNGQTQIVAVDNQSQNRWPVQRFSCSTSTLSPAPHGRRPKVNLHLFQQWPALACLRKATALVIGPENIRVTGKPAGFSTACRPLTAADALRPKPAIQLPALDITDYPLLVIAECCSMWKALFTVTYLKKYLDLAAQYKITISLAPHDDKVGGSRSGNTQADRGGPGRV